MVYIRSKRSKKGVNIGGRDVKLAERGAYAATLFLYPMHHLS